VAGYLAKYATKTATDDIAVASAYGRRLRATVADLDLQAQVSPRLLSSPALRAAPKLLRSS